MRSSLKEGKGQGYAAIQAQQLNTMIKYIVDILMEIKFRTKKFSPRALIQPVRVRVY
jgi:ABC-type uncharacterized transport system permease subunit